MPDKFFCVFLRLMYRRIMLKGVWCLPRRAVALCAAVCVSALLCAGVRAQSADGRYREYIERYAAMAVAQQEAHGVPASITLAQGLLESAAGRSTLATRGNNHFGIKCHAGWEGEYMLRDDDAPDECFRVYGTAAESFEDHSRFLRRKRYAPLFELDGSDYAGWARGLSRCGYATDPNYADRLIAIIERYALYVYDSASGREAEETAHYIWEHLRASHPVRRSRGLHYVIAAPGDTYGSLAKEFRIKKKKLLEYNDVRRDGPVREWQEVYLEPKRDEAPAGVERATIGQDESIHSLSQRYGVKLSRLRELNPRAADEPGTVIRMR